ncbi:hypothetical protein FACS1894187_11770 [Synergistales bacterium]|nr:hypothetical protein FACS1894187_11770 [Synergistales bacterium]
MKNRFCGIIFKTIFKTIFKAIFKTILCAVICLNLAMPSDGAQTPARATSAVMEIIVTSPWLNLLASFIGGVNVHVTSIQEWNEEGELIRRIRARNLQSLPPETLLMAFDYRDAKGLGLPIDIYPNYRPLYDRLPLDESKIDTFLSDPSVMPLIAQRVLMVLADWDPENYPYYQRRLAEFPARISSTTLAGRQILKGQKIYDLTGHSNAILQAAGCVMTRPSDEEWASWSVWRGMGTLTANVARLAEEKYVVVLDCSTPKAIRAYLGSNQNVFLIVRPKPNQDYPAYLHDQYISLWTKITSRPLPTPARRRNTNP